MAKRTKQQLAELDEAIDQLGGGVAPIARPRRKVTRRRVTKPRVTKKSGTTGNTRKR